jgi:hypothetical protein
LAGQLAAANPGMAMINSETPATQIRIVFTPQFAHWPSNR